MTPLSTAQRFELALLCVDHEAREYHTEAEFHESLEPVTRYVAEHGIVIEQFTLMDAKQLAPAGIAAAFHAARRRGLCP